MKLRKIVQSGSLGGTRVVHYNARDAKTSSRYVHTYINGSGGICCDSAIHQLDYVVWMLGERPSSLMVVGDCSSQEAEHFKAYDDVDHVLITLLFPSGAHAYIEVLRETQRDFPYFRMEVVGTEGTHFSHKVTSDMLATQDMDGSGQEERCPMDFAHSYKEELDCFVRVVQGKEECPVAGEDVIFANHLADLCLTSLREKRMVSVSPLNTSGLTDG